MNIEQLIDKLKTMKPDWTLTVGKVIETLEKIEAQEPLKTGRQLSRDPRQFYPCECGGRLILMTTNGIDSFGQFVRYRQCNKCEKRVKTDESIIKIMPNGDCRAIGKTDRYPAKEEK